CRELRLSLTDSTFGVETRLTYGEPALFELCLKHCNLVTSLLDLRFRLLDRRSLLVFTSLDLFVIEHRDKLAGFYRVALAHSDFADATGCFRGNRGVVAFDPAAQRDDSIGRGLSSEQKPPGRRSGDQNQH